MKPLALSLILAIGIALGFFNYAKAATDLTLANSDITFSKENPLAGEKIRIFARVFNTGDVDAYGFVIFLSDNKEIADPQPISVKINTYDDVFIDWLAQAGNHEIKVKIINTNPKDANLSNNETQKTYFVDLDNDQDGLGDSIDPDDDNDGLTDEKEQEIGTDLFNQDTDHDGVQDGLDAFPLDINESKDNDHDGIGDNTDPDDDNDGLTDQEEKVLGSNVFNFDSDEDGLSDKEEKELGTSYWLKDTDGDGVSDKKDSFPLDPTKNQASVIDALKSELLKRNISPSQTLGLAILLAFVSFLTFVFIKKG